METWTEFVMLQLGRFNSSDLKQTTLKSPQFASFANGNHEDKLFLISIWNSKLRKVKGPS